MNNLREDIEKILTFHGIDTIEGYKLEPTSDMIDQLLALFKERTDAIIGEDEVDIEPSYDRPHPYADERNKLRKEQRELLKEI